MLLKLLHSYYALQHLTMNPNHEILFFHKQRKKKKKTLDHKKFEQKIQIELKISV